jgi:F-box-like
MLADNDTHIMQDLPCIKLEFSNWLESEGARAFIRDIYPAGKAFSPHFRTPPMAVTRELHRTVIGQHEKEIQKLLMDASALNEASLRLKAVYAPITLIPDELLGQIFLLARPTDFAFADGKTPFYSVLMVCRFWRRVALKTPQLFAYFHLGNTINSKTTHPYDYRRAKIAEWADKAKAIPWHIKTGKLCREEYWIIIADHLRQWRTWEHQGNSKFIYHFVLTQASKMVRLEELSMSFKMEPDVAVPQLGIEVTFPSLKKMCLGWGALDHLPRFYAPHLTELELDTPTTSDLEHCASAYPELSTLTLTFLTARTVRCKLPFPKLHTFNCTVQDRLSSSIDGLLPAISSTVKQMTLRRTMPGLEVGVQFFHLETLRLENIDADRGGEELITKLFDCAVPNLKNLTFIRSDAGSHLCKVLSNSHVCPQLKTAHLEDLLLARTELHAFAQYRSNRPKSKYRSLDEMQRCLITLKNVFYANSLYLPDVEGVDWPVIKGLKAARTVEDGSCNLTRAV